MKNLGTETHGDEGWIIYARTGDRHVLDNKIIASSEGCNVELDAEDIEGFSSGSQGFFTFPRTLITSLQAHYKAEFPTLRDKIELELNRQGWMPRGPRVIVLASGSKFHASCTDGISRVFAAFGPTEEAAIEALAKEVFG